MKNSQAFKYLLITISVLSVLVLSIGIYNIITINAKDGGDVNTNLTSLENEYYVIGKNPTEAQKENFLLLTEAIEEGNENAIAEFLVKAFVLDFFTWTNKDGAWDVGGLQYVHDPKGFVSIAAENYYINIDVFINEYGQDKLQEVESVSTVNIEKNEEMFVVGENEYVAYTVEAKWQYVSNKTIDTSLLQDELVFVVIDNQGRFEIVKFSALETEVN